MDIEIRQDFPVLRRQLSGRPIVYLDSAATTLKPLAVLDEERRYSTDFTANVHRGKHLLSEEASDAYESARRKVAEFLSVSPSVVCFTRNATEAITTVARGLGLSKSDKVLLPINEHHSNILPWMREASLVWIEQHPEEPLDLAAVVSALERERPRVLTFSTTSNVTGATNPGAEICRAARQLGVLTCVDASQTTPHEEVSVPALGCDFMAFSGHKMLGPTGIGVLTGTPEALDRLEPLILGGGTVERVTTSGYALRPLPYRLEAGTPNISGAIGLAAAVDYLTTIGFENIRSHQVRLTARLQAVLSDIKGCRPLMACKGSGVPIGALAMPQRHFSLDDVAVSLSENFGVMARSGFFCAHPLIERLGISGSLLRLSAYIYNSDEDIQHFHRAMNTIMHRMS